MPTVAFHPRWHTLTVVFLTVTTLARLALLPALELAPDEAYYWDWSRHFALGYYDQGPMVAYVIRLTCALFGTNEFGVRFGALAFCLLTLICAYILARRFFSPLAGFLTVMLLGATPLMAVGSLIATYDPMLVGFWALALVFLERACFAPTLAEQRRGWLLAGVATGLGFLSKHTMLLLVPCLVLFLAVSPAQRVWLRRPEPYAAFLLAMLLYGGVFYWNAHHHWWTFGHLLFLTAKSQSPPLRRFGEFLGSQALLLGPGLFVVCVATMFPARNRAVNDPSDLAHAAQAPSLGGPAANRPADGGGKAIRTFLVCFGAPIFLFFCLLSLRAKVQGNWAPFAWITPTILWAGWLTARLEHRQGHPLRLLSIVVGLSLFLTLALLWPGLRFALGLRLPPDADLSNTTYGWRQLAAHVQQTRQEMAQNSKRPVFIAGNGYQYCALMAFYLPARPPTYDLFLHFRLTMYAAYVENLKAHLGEDCVFINDGEADDADLRKIFTRVEWEEPLAIYRPGYSNAPVHILHIARCYGYRLYTGLDWARGG